MSLVKLYLFKKYSTIILTCYMEDRIGNANSTQFCVDFTCISKSTPRCYKVTDLRISWLVERPSLKWWLSPFSPPVCLKLYWYCKEILGVDNSWQLPLFFPTGVERVTTISVWPPLWVSFNMLAINASHKGLSGTNWTLHKLTWQDLLAANQWLHNMVWGT